MNGTRIHKAQDTERPAARSRLRGDGHPTGLRHGPNQSSPSADSPVSFQITSKPTT
jgi:hypothetical protein